MSCNCNNNANDCCEMIDDLLESIQNGLGKVDYDKIDSYIDEKIRELQDDIISGEITASIDKDALIAEIKDALSNGDLLLDAYQVPYKETTVGDKLDELTKKPFIGKISDFRSFEIGEIVHNARLSWNFNKGLKKLTLGVYVNDMNTGTFDLDVTKGYYDIPVLTNTTKFVVKGVSVDEDELILTSEAIFTKKYYVGCSGSTRLTNKEVLGLTSYFAYDHVNKYNFTFNPIGKQYLWWAFPVELHLDYDFFNNGLLDSNYVWTTGNVTNEYGYTSEYIFMRSGNPQTAHNIYTEVIAHEHK